MNFFALTCWTVQPPGARLVTLSSDPRGVYRSGIVDPDACLPLREATVSFRDVRVRDRVFRTVNVVNANGNANARIGF